MNGKIRISIWTVATAISCFAMSLTACSNDEGLDEVILQDRNEVNNMPEAEQQQTEAKLCAYAIMPAQPQVACKARTGTRGTEGALFTDYDIEWFDVNTRELRFRDTPPQLRYLPMLGGIDFYLDGECLFNVGATYVGLICNMVFLDLVLCQGRIDEGHIIDDCYYLQDCYPLECADSEEVKNNRLNRAAQWEKLTKYLESKGKLRK